MVHVIRESFACWAGFRATKAGRIQGQDKLRTHQEQTVPHVHGGRAAQCQKHPLKARIPEVRVIILQLGPSAWCLLPQTAM